MTGRVQIIAEAGVNHNGDPDLALRLIDAAAEAGADIVKFQTFRAEALVSRRAEKALYQKKTTDAAETQLEMLRRLEFGPEIYVALLARCAERRIGFLSTPFDIESLRFLTDRLDVDSLKLSSGEITNAPLLLEAARSGRRIILSTGMSTLEEVRQALGVVAFGLCEAKRIPRPSDFVTAGASSEGRRRLADRVTLLHCTSEYPAPFEDANLRALATLRDAFGLPVGLSDHTEGIAIPIAAAALGACVVEKHFTLDRGLPGPDHPASLLPDELAAMVASIRAVERALGSGEKTPRPCEIDNLKTVRRSLVALRAIRRGEQFTVDNLGAKRPGDGLSPMAFWDRLGRYAERDYAADEPIL